MGLGVCQVAKGTMSLDFYRITDNNPTDLSGQFSVDVTADASYFYFKFINSGPVESKITQLYWDDGLLPSAIFDAALSSPGVAFTSGATPSDLPGGNMVGFEATKELSAQRDPNVNFGIGPYEYATIKFAIGGAFPDLTSLEAALTDFTLNPKAYLEPTLWIGMHVQSQGLQSTSDGYVHTSTRVPDGGATAALVGLGILGLGYISRRKA